MRACAGVGQCDFSDACGRGWLIKRPVRAEEAAMAVRGVLAEADVACDVEIREVRAYFADCADDGAVWVIRGGTALILPRVRASICGARGWSYEGRTLLQLRGTPNRMTLRRPFLTSGPRNSSSLFTPHLH